jgi:hypothetical protein
MNVFGSEPSVDFTSQLSSQIEVALIESRHLTQDAVTSSCAVNSRADARRELEDARQMRWHRDWKIAIITLNRTGGGLQVLFIWDARRLFFLLCTLDSI